MKKVIIILIIVGVVGVIALSFSGVSEKWNLNLTGSNTDSTEGDLLADVPEEVVPPEIKKVDEQNNTYLHKKYNFTFNFPSSLKTSNFIEGGGEQILFSGDNGDWFQIYITPWDEEGDISVTRIKKDLPDIVILEPQKVILGPRQKEGVGPHALIFFSKESGLGETREVWFVQNGNLYQITTYKKLDLKLGQILATLVFQ